MSDKNWLQAAAEQVKKFTPTKGYNVVAVDRLEKPGEALYLVGHTDDEKEAERMAAAHQKKTGDAAHVYGPA